MREPTVLLSAVPVDNIRCNAHHRTRLQRYRFFSFFLVPAFACRTDQDLASAGCPSVDVPEASGSGLKADVAEHHGTTRHADRFKVGLPGHVVLHHQVIDTCTEIIGFIKALFICVFHLLRLLSPYFLRHIEYRPALRPSGIKCDMCNDRHDLFLCNACLLRIHQVEL